ncbi:MULTISPECIES: methyltransferase [Rhodomicrobium]|uniref:methyltransferase n=1 Tax=Rhodomicrobium TaxID=1068 RepID=UPI001482226B|nr:MULTISPECIES: methyltransferase [Rhodomicrobium]
MSIGIDHEVAYDATKAADGADPGSEQFNDMMQMITGYWIAQIVRGAADCSLADHLHAAPRSAQEIAALENIDTDVAYRFLRACAALKLVAVDERQRFVSTPLLDTLRRDRLGSLRGLALSQPAPGHWLPWGRFVDVLRTGKRQTVEAIGAELFDYYATVPDEARAFSDSMKGATSAVALEVCRLVDTSNTTQVVDIGGATGALMYVLMHANKKLRGVVFDLPSIVEHARVAASAEGLSDRVEIGGGDFFEDVPAGDLYLLKWILHDWSDEASLRILRNCRRRLLPNGRIILVEWIIGDLGDGGMAPLMDVNMMVLLSGRERTFEEYRRLLETSGFRDVRMTPTNWGLTVIEAVGNGD